MKVFKLKLYHVSDISELGRRCVTCDHFKSNSMLLGTNDHAKRPEQGGTFVMTTVEGRLIKLFTTQEPITKAKKEKIKKTFKCSSIIFRGPE